MLTYIVLLLCIAKEPGAEMTTMSMHLQTAQLIRAAQPHAQGTWNQGRCAGTAGHSRWVESPTIQPFCSLLMVILASGSGALPALPVLSHFLAWTFSPNKIILHLILSWHLSTWEPRLIKQYLGKKTMVYIFDYKKTLEKWECITDTSTCKSQCPQYPPKTEGKKSSNNFFSVLLLFKNMSLQYHWTDSALWFIFSYGSSHIFL